MGVIYVADTNIVSEIMRPRPNHNVQVQWQQHNTQIAITTVTWHELLTGTRLMSHSKRREAIHSFLFDTLQVTAPILPYDQTAAEWHAYERARLSQLGRPPSFSDGQIAAIAATNDLTLVTRNVADFAGFAGLTIENWFKEKNTSEA
jgi:tRNA(fMet)-specific endonuclease VapC